MTNSGKPENPALLVDVQQMPGNVFTMVKQRIEAARANCKCKPKIEPGDASPVQRMERPQRGREMPWIKKRETSVNSKPDLGYWFVLEGFDFCDYGLSSSHCGAYPDTYPDIYNDGSGPGNIDTWGEGGFLQAQNSLDMSPDPRDIWPMYYGKAEGVGKFYTSIAQSDTSRNSEKFNGIDNIPYQVCDVDLYPWKDVSNAPYNKAKCASPRSSAGAEIGAQFVQGMNAVAPYRRWGNSTYAIALYRNLGTELMPEYAVTTQYMLWQNWAGFKEQNEEFHTNCGGYRVEGQLFTGRHASTPEQLLACQKGRHADSIEYMRSHVLRAKYMSIRMMISDVWSSDPYSEKPVIADKARFYVHGRQMGVRDNGVTREFEVGDKVRIGCHAFVRPGESRETDMYVGTVVEKFVDGRLIDVCLPSQYDCNGIAPVAYVRNDITGQVPYVVGGFFEGSIELTEQPMCENWETYNGDEIPDCPDAFYEPWRAALAEYREAKRRNPGGIVKRKQPSLSALGYDDDLYERFNEQETDLGGVNGPGDADQKRRLRKHAPESTDLLEWIEYKRHQYLEEAAEKLGRKYGSPQNYVGAGLKNILDDIDIPIYTSTQIPRPWNNQCDPNKWGLYSDPEQDVTYVVEYEKGTEQQLNLGQPGLMFAAQWFGFMVQVFEEGTPVTPEMVINNGGWWDQSNQGWIVEDTEGNSRRTPVQEFGKLNHWHLTDSATHFMGSHNGMAFFRQHMEHTRYPTDSRCYLDNLPWTEGLETRDLETGDYSITSRGYINKQTPDSFKFDNTSSSAPYTHLYPNYKFPCVGTWSEPVDNPAYARQGGWWEGTNRPSVYGNGLGDSIESVNFGPFMKCECLFSSVVAEWKKCGAPECHYDIRYFEWDLENGKMNNQTEWMEFDYQGECGEVEWMQKDQGWGYGIGDKLEAGMQNRVSNYHYDLWKLEADYLPDWIPWKKARQAGHNITWDTNSDNSMAFMWVSGSTSSGGAMPVPTDEFVEKPFLYQWPVDAAIFAAENWDKWYEVTNIPYTYETPEFEDRLPDGWQKFEIQIARKDFPHGLQFSKTNPMPRPKKWHYYYANRMWCPPKRGVYG